MIVHVEYGMVQIQSNLERSEGLLLQSSPISLCPPFVGYFALTSKRRQAEIFSRHQSSLVNIGKINMAAECLRIVAKELME